MYIHNASYQVAGELAATSMGTSVDLEAKFRELEGDTKIEDELERMKRQLPSGLR